MNKMKNPLASFEDIYYRLSNINEDINNKEYEIIKLYNNNINNLHQTILKHNKDIIMFNMNEYLHDILNSYNYDIYKINQQFDIDFNRSNIFINDIKINDKNLIDIHFNNLEKYKLFDNFNMLLIIKMLCNQSSFGFPFILLNKIYNYYNDDYIISDGKTNRYIKFNTIDKLLTIIIGTDLILNKITTNGIEFIKKIHIHLVIHTNLIKTNSEYILNNNDIYCKNGLLYIDIYNLDNTLE